MLTQRRAIRGAAAVAVIAAPLLAGCSSSSTKRSDSGPRTTPSSTASAATPTWQAPFYASAKPAVDALTDVLAAYSAAVESPTTSTAKSFDKYLTGQAAQAFDGAFAGTRKEGIEYRGTPAQPRILVTSNKVAASLPEVVLENCGLISATDPFVAYHAKTGTKVAVPAPDVAPPYPQTAKAFYLKGRWLITSFTTDQTRTCTR